MTSRQRWTLLAAIIGSGAVFLDGTIVNLALKRIGEELPASLVGVLEGQTYIVSGYLAVLAALLIVAGALSDHYGRRKVFAIGLAAFLVSSALCGLAPTMEWLILFRLLQGAAGALLVPGSLALITGCFEGPERGRAFGIWASATSALTLLGPLVGGLLVDTIGWRVAFLINVPVLAFALWVVLRHVEESRDLSSDRPFDWLGSVVAAIAVGGLSAGLIRGQEGAWQDPLAWVLVVVGGIAFVAFPILMATRPNPLVPLSLFKSRAFTSINLATFFIYGALYVTLPAAAARARSSSRASCWSRPRCSGTRACRSTPSRGAWPSTTHRPGSRRSTRSPTSCRPAS
jgi:MFS family permease